MGCCPRARCLHPAPCPLEASEPAWSHHQCSVSAATRTRKLGIACQGTGWVELLRARAAKQLQQVVGQVLSLLLTRVPAT